MSGPSGTGKTSIVAAVLERTDTRFSVSATTRSARPGETDGADYIFVTTETFETMRPRPLKKFWPEIDKIWGIGLTSTKVSHPDAGKDAVPRDKTILSPDVIGHGSATATVFSVDFENDLIVTQTRRRGDKEYYANLQKCLMALEDGLVD